MLADTTENNEILVLKINQIIDFNKRLAKFWKNSNGWAGDETFEIIFKSRLDLMVSFSYRLNDMCRIVSPEEQDAHLISCWITIKSLIESTLALFVMVHRDSYIQSPVKHTYKKRHFEPNELSSEQLRKIMIDNELLSKDLLQWISEVQQCRNAVHFLRDRKIGDKYQMRSSVEKYLQLLVEVDSQLPYPDSQSSSYELDYDYLRSH